MGVVFDNHAAAVIADQFPVVPAPSVGSLVPLEPGQRRYVLARNGLYLEGCSLGIEFAFKLCDVAHVRHGEFSEYLKLRHGPLPEDFRQALIERAVAASPTESAGLVWVNDAGDYQLHFPEPHTASGGHITYNADEIDVQHVVVDCHSHGAGGAYFSSVDDKSDQDGIYLAMVIGRCNSTSTVTTAQRVVAHGIFCEIGIDLWEIH